jgi:hypothetical protein
LRGWGEFGEEGVEEGFEVGEGGFWGGGVEVVDVPIADFGGEVGVEAFDEGAVFGFFEGDDEVGGLEVGEGELLGKACRRGGDIADLEGLEGVGGEVAVVDDAIGLDAEAAGGGVGGEVGLGGEVVKEDFGEAGAVVVAGAEEEDVHHAEDYGR